MHVSQIKFQTNEMPVFVNEAKPEDILKEVQFFHFPDLRHGVTVCLLRDISGRCAVGLASVNHKDQFCRKIGRDVSQGYAEVAWMEGTSFPTPAGVSLKSAEVHKAVTQAVEKYFGVLTTHTNSEYNRGLLMNKVQNALVAQFPVF